MTPERLAECKHWIVLISPFPTEPPHEECSKCRWMARAIIAAQQAHIRDLEAQLAAARESKELVRMMLEMSRARRSLRAPEDDGIRSLCERLGYGAVIDSAARLWQQKDPIGAFAVGPCVGTLESVLATATPPSPEVGE